MRNHLDVLDEEIASLFAEVFALTARALAKLAELDALEGWAHQGFQSCGHYLNYRVGMSLGAAREHVRVARALEALPLTRAKFSAGTLSYSKVRALTRIATPETEASYLAVANDTTASQLEKIVRACRRVTLEEAQHQMQSRSVEMRFDDDGMFVLHARLTPEEGARLMHALDAAAPADKTRACEERRADALMALASSPASTTEVIVHVDAETSGGQVETPRGERVAISAETARRLACDASVVVMTHDADGKVLDVGRRSRRVSAGIRRALAARDGGCRYPGCSNHRVDAHHVTHWADGGETKLSNMILLCRFHHGRLHEGGFRVELAADGTATFFDPRGRALAPTAPLPVATGTALAATTPVAPWPGTSWLARSIDYGYVVSCLV